VIDCTTVAVIKRVINVCRVKGGAAPLKYTHFKLFREIVDEFKSAVTSTANAQEVLGLRTFPVLFNGFLTVHHSVDLNLSPTECTILFIQ
jgi:hypothetical protein